MRTLKFIVTDQIIAQDPKCDFSGLVPGTAGYVQAEFSFSSEWAGFTKVAAFWSALGKEYPPQILRDGKSCMIPAEALERRTFKVQVIGKGPNSKKLTTNKVEVIQNGGAKT